MLSGEGIEMMGMIRVVGLKLEGCIIVGKLLRGMRLLKTLMTRSYRRIQLIKYRIKVILC